MTEAKIKLIKPIASAITGIVYALVDPQSVTHNNATHNLSQIAHTAQCIRLLIPSFNKETVGTHRKTFPEDRYVATMNHLAYFISTNQNRNILVILLYCIFMHFCLCFRSLLSVTVRRMCGRAISIIPKPNSHHWHLICFRYCPHLSPVWHGEWAIIYT